MEALAGCRARLEISRRTWREGDFRGSWPEVSVRQFKLENFARRGVGRERLRDGGPHYVSYAYQPKGMPVWLPGADRGMEAEQSAAPARYDVSRNVRAQFTAALAVLGRARLPGGLFGIWSGFLMRGSSCDRYFNQLTSEFGAEAECGRIIPIGSNIPCVTSWPEKWVTAGDAKIQNRGLRSGKRRACGRSSGTGRFLRPLPTRACLSPSRCCEREEPDDKR